MDYSSFQRMSAPSPTDWHFVDELQPPTVLNRPTSAAIVANVSSCQGYTSSYADQLRRIYARLFPYQRELFRVALLQDSIVYLQTGGGKTWVAAALTCFHLATCPTSRVFFIVGTVALAQQQQSVLQGLLESDVACVGGGTRRYRSAADFLADPACRVAVIVDTKFFRWISERPDLIADRQASLLLLDEVHHARSGAYQKICELFHALRGNPQSSTSASSPWGDVPDTRAALRTTGQRTPAASVFATRLQKAVQEEAQLRGACGGAATPLGMGDSPVLETLLREFPRDVRRPQLVGLSASPVVRFDRREQELVLLLKITRCRLVGVVEETADLEAHLPHPSLVALSYLPLYSERVLQTELRRAIVHLYRRVEALIGESAARKKLDALRTTSVVSPGFAVYCSTLSDLATESRFMSKLRIPPGSELWEKVDAYRAEVAAVQKRDSSTPWSSPQRVRPLPLVGAEAEIMCADFIQRSLKLMACLSASLIALESTSAEEMLSTFFKDFHRDELLRIKDGCGAITSVVLRPVLQSLVLLMVSVRRRHLAPLPMEQAGGDGATASPPVPPSNARDSSTVAALRSVPAPLRHFSTRTQVYVRFFTELAIFADAMARAPGNTAERDLRVLVFVETRDDAVRLMRLLSLLTPLVYAMLRPDVLLGKANGSGSDKNSMTRAQQTAVLQRFRDGNIRLLFATSVAEEGIDVPACHVVLRCHPQTELRNIVQCCGRLRMKRTLFISVSNLLDGHPRLGYIMDATKNFETTLAALAGRCRHDAWTLERDELLDGVDGAFLGDSAAASPLGARPIPDAASRLTTQESTLLVRQREILMGLEAFVGTEVYCVVSRDLPSGQLEGVQYAVLMPVPVVRHGGGDGGWDCVFGCAAGGHILAHQRAFVNFCKAAQERGLLTKTGEPPSLPSTQPPSSLLTRLRVTPLEESLAQLQCCGSYAHNIASMVVFLGHTLCLCRRTTWPPEVLKRFFDGRAAEMVEYNHDLWTSSVLPQKVLREELAVLRVPPPQFHLPMRGTDEARRHAADAGNSGPNSAEEWTDRWDEESGYSSTYRTDSNGSRQWYRNLDTDTVLTAQASFLAEVRFCVPLHVVSTASSTRSATAPTLSAEGGGVRSYETASRCRITERIVTMSYPGLSGKDTHRQLLEVQVSFRGLDACRAVCVEGLRQLGVTVVYGVDETELLEALKCCRRVSVRDGS